MKIRTLQELNDLLDESMAWRRKEITTVGFQIAKARNHEKQILTRCGIVLLCGHLEGYLKEGADAYLEFVANQNVKKANLATCLLVASMKGELASIVTSEKATHILGILKCFNGLDQSIDGFLWKGEIDTHSNPNSQTVEEILAILGIDNVWYSTKFNFLDHELTKNRHEVAHGARILIDESTFSECKGGVFEIIERFRTDVINSASFKSYLRS